MAGNGLIVAALLVAASAALSAWAPDGEGQTVNKDQRLQPSDVQARHPIARIDIPDNATLHNPAGRVPLRRAPAADADVVAWLDDGARLYVWAEHGDWLEVRHADGRRGFVPRAAIKRDP